MVSAALGYHENEVGFDCVSPSEIRLTLSSCFASSSRNENRKENALSCIYANPQCAKTDLDYALGENVKALTFDSEEEL